MARAGRARPLLQQDPVIPMGFLSSPRGRGSLGMARGQRDLNGLSVKGPSSFLLPVSSTPFHSNTQCLFPVCPQHQGWTRVKWRRRGTGLLFWAAPYLCWLKRRATWELRIKFYLGQNEDCSLGDSTSESSERLLQRGSGENSIYKILVREEFTAIKRSLNKRLSASHEGI